MQKSTAGVFQKIFIALLCVATVSYTIYHLSSLFSEDISTIVVGSSVENTKLSLDGYVFRNETVINSAYSGAVDYAVSDGTKVASGERLAVVYENGSTEKVRNLVAMLDKQIKVLEDSTSGSLNMSQITELKETAGNAYYTAVKMLASGEASGLPDTAGVMLAAMNKTDMLINDKSVVNETLDSLRKSREAYISAGGNSEDISASKSGYFYSVVDGYEDIFTLDAAENMTAGDFFKLIRERPSNVGTSSVGKMAYDSEWKFAVTVKKSEQQYFEFGKSYDVELDGNITVTVSMELERVEESGDSKAVLLVFSCDRLPSDFEFTRVISCGIVVKSVNGIYVPASAVHRTRKKDGVYILRGSVVLFRHIDIIYEGSDYYIVKDGIPDDNGDVFLQSNDLLIIGGTNLFDGRILD